jgi:hypothetical protein
VCFVTIRFQHRQITLPLFEREWISLKIELCQYSLPKVQFATKALPKDFSPFSKRKIPYVPVKWVLAAVFMWQCGKGIWRHILTVRFVLCEKR